MTWLKLWCTGAVSGANIVLRAREEYQHYFVFISVQSNVCPFTPAVILAIIIFWETHTWLFSRQMPPECCHLFDAGYNGFREFFFWQKHWPVVAKNSTDERELWEWTKTIDVGKKANTVIRGHRYFYFGSSLNQFSRTESCDPFSLKVWTYFNFHSHNFFQRINWFFCWVSQQKTKAEWGIKVGLPLRQHLR